MVLALLDGRKTQTRRLTSLAEVGDLIWVRERWRTYHTLDHLSPFELLDDGRGGGVFFDAGGNLSLSKDEPRQWHFGDERDHPGAGKTRSSIHMPKWASRITLRVEEVRRERLQDISPLDAYAEGMPDSWHEAMRYGLPGAGDDDGHLWDNSSGIENYARLMDHLHGAGFWASNPEVTVITSEVMRNRNVGEFLV